MHGKKKHDTEITPWQKSRSARDRQIGAVIEYIVSWICVLACVALLILLSGRSVPAGEPSAAIVSKIVSNELFHQTGDKGLNG